jgi:uncharacterized protein (TIGR03083 family)
MTPAMRTEHAKKKVRFTGPASHRQRQTPQFRTLGWAGCRSSTEEIDELDELLVAAFVSHGSGGLGTFSTIRKMDDVDYSVAFIEQNRLFAQVVLSAEPETPIPTCPGWTLRHLVRHVGRAQRWAAQIMTTGADVTLDPRSVPNGRPPDDADGAQAWLHACPEVLLDAVAHVGGPEVIVATFSGPRPAKWWIRRLLHETTVHRADAALAVREPFELAPEVAADGIDEWLGRLAERPWQGDLPIEDGRQVSFIAIDVDASWTMLRRGNELRLRRNSIDSLSGAKLQGSATGLLLALFRRLDTETAGCRVEGDSSSWTSFLARTPYNAPETQ